MLAKKNASSIEIEQRNAKSGQVSGGDKNARVSDQLRSLYRSNSILKLY